MAKQTDMVFVMCAIMKTLASTSIPRIRTTAVFFGLNWCLSEHIHDAISSIHPEIAISSSRLVDLCSASRSASNALLVPVALQKDEFQSRSEAVGTPIERLTSSVAAFKSSKTKQYDRDRLKISATNGATKLETSSLHYYPSNRQ